MSRMRTDLTKIAEKDLYIMHNLSRLYSYDISEISDADYYRCRENGLFEGGCEKYKPEHCDIYLIRVQDELAGFAIAGPHYKKDPIFKEADALFTIWEFFVLRRFRHKGIGTAIAHRLFKQYRGPWYVAVWPLNGVAVTFWHKAISRYAGDRYSCNLEIPEGYDEQLFVYRFQNTS